MTSADLTPLALPSVYPASPAELLLGAVAEALQVGEYRLPHRAGLVQAAIAEALEAPAATRGAVMFLLASDLDDVTRRDA